jgi:tetratricopeptide (TPR) repeat protein
MIAFQKIPIKRWTFPLLCLLLIRPASVPAQSGGGARAAPTTQRLEELREKGSAALFNLDYEAARQTFKEMARLAPDDPIGPQMLAWTLWLETLNKIRLRQAAIYSSQSFTANAEDKPDTRVAQEFHDLMRQAMQLARTRLQRNPRDPQALYTLAAIENLNASFELSVEGRFLAGLRDSSTSIDRDREVIKLDPNFHDAELTIGMYDYVVGNLPLALKLVASLAGARGSKKRGMLTLERVAKDGHWERDNAKLLLMALYKHQKRFAESLALSRELQEKYPRNYLFKLETADTFASEAIAERQANRIPAADALEKEALSMFDSLLREHSAVGAAIGRLDLIHFRYGETLLLLGQPDSAAQQFHLATTAAGADAGLVTRAHLRDAQSLDLGGKRTEALAEYRLVTTRPNTDDSLAQARRGLKEPYKMGK